VLILDHKLKVCQISDIYKGFSTRYQFWSIKSFSLRDLVVHHPPPSPRESTHCVSIKRNQRHIILIAAMKFSAIASIAFLRQVAGQSSCPSELSQKVDISSTETLYYEVIDGVFCARMESESEGWLGFGISPDGGMVPSEAVIGLPDDGTVLKYDLTSKAESGVVAMSDEKQTLMDTSIEQADGTTIMTFAKIMDEDQYPLVIGDNTCIYAQAGSNTLGYHGGRGSFTLTLQESTTGTTSTAAPESTEPTNSGSSGAYNDSGSSSGNVARIGTVLLGAGAIVAWFGL
jgi:hypothetical protein